jgi:hypothetical protein
MANQFIGSGNASETNEGKVIMRTESLIVLAGFAGLVVFALAAQDKQPAAATTPAATAPVAQKSESSEAGISAMTVVYIEKCHDDLDPSYVLGSILRLESFPPDVRRAAHDKEMTDYYRGPSLYCSVFGRLVRRDHNSFLDDRAKR